MFFLQALEYKLPHLIDLVGLTHSSLEHDNVEKTLSAWCLTSSKIKEVIPFTFTGRGSPSEILNDDENNHVQKVLSTQEIPGAQLYLSP